MLSVTNSELSLRAIFVIFSKIALQNVVREFCSIYTYIERRIKFITRRSQTDLIDRAWFMENVLSN